ncbi:endothelial cell-selective adhesion molecule [Ctenodactylus gundi]
MVSPSGLPVTNLLLFLFLGLSAFGPRCGSSAGLCWGLHRPQCAAAQRGCPWGGRRSRPEPSVFATVHAKPPTLGLLHSAIISADLASVGLLWRRWPALCPGTKVVPSGDRFWRLSGASEKRGIPGGLLCPASASWPAGQIPRDVELLEAGLFLPAASPVQRPPPPVIVLGLIVRRKFPALPAGTRQETGRGSESKESGGGSAGTRAPAGRRGVGASCRMAAGRGGDGAGDPHTLPAVWRPCESGTRGGRRRAQTGRGQLEVHMPKGVSKLEAVEGAEVVLPAWYSLQGEMSLKPKEVPFVTWFLGQEANKDLDQVLAYINGVVSSKPRVSLVHSMPSRNVSLRLQKLEEGDSGFYTCSVNVQNGKDISRSHSSKTIELDVQVPPATPSCHLAGVPHAGTDVSLSCQSPRSKPAARYQWQRLPPSPQVFFAPLLDEVSGSLRLTNLSSSMSGVYVCKASNVVGSAQCNVTLEAFPGSNAAVIAGATVGTVVGLVLLAGLVLLYQRRGKAVEELPNDIKEDAPAPRTLPWSKGSDTISKNGTLSSVTSARALRPPHAPAKSNARTPTPSLSSQALSSPKTNGTHPRPVLVSPGGVSTSTLIHMGALPVMVPAQSQAGSLV